jgi:hypothetical protein
MDSCLHQESKVMELQAYPERCKRAAQSSQAEKGEAVQ